MPLLASDRTTEPGSQNRRNNRWVAILVERSDNVADAHVADPIAIKPNNFNYALQLAGAQPLLQAVTHTARLPRRHSKFDQLRRDPRRRRSAGTEQQ